MPATYLFYDLETTGLNKCFDQILQFAAIRTDLELNEIERHQFKIKLNPDQIPAPKALLTHNIPFSEILEGDCEYEAIRKIHQLFNQPNTISVGYNNLEFDDEFLRFSFYRNLLPPYTHQYANGCKRMDIYPITVMYHLYNNDVLTWPKIEAKTSFKLEHLNNHNQLAQGKSHDALIDVEVTLALARRLIKNRPMWDYLLKYFSKEHDLARIQKLPSAIIVDGIFGTKQDFQKMAWSLGVHNHYRNQYLWLYLDDPELNKITENTVSNLRIYRKKAGESGLLLPPIARYVDRLDKDRQTLIIDNQRWLEKNTNILNAISNHFREYKYPIVPNADIEATLYQDGFSTDYEQMLCNQFHALPVHRKHELLPKFKEGTKLFKLATRILGRNYYQLLPETYQKHFQDFLAAINSKHEEPGFVDYKNQKRLTPALALHEVSEILAENKVNEEQVALMTNYKNYLAKKFLNDQQYDTPFA